MSSIRRSMARDMAKKTMKRRGLVRPCACSGARQLSPRVKRRLGRCALAHDEHKSFFSANWRAFKPIIKPVKAK